MSFQAEGGFQNNAFQNDAFQMAVWPTDLSAPWFPVEEKTEATANRAPFESGYVQSRSRHTRTRKTFTLHWRFMRTADADLLRDFYTAVVNAGMQSFLWTHPATAVGYDVRFVGNSLNTVDVAPGWVQASVDLAEV